LIVALNRKKYVVAGVSLWTVVLTPAPMTYGDRSARLAPEAV
jgi:hypothetical protein